MKIKNILKSTLAGILLVATIATTAFAANYDYKYNLEHQLTLNFVVDGDKKAFTSGGRGTAESTGIFGGKVIPSYLYTRMESENWTVYVDDTITWSLKDDTLVISGNGITGNCSTAVTPFYDNVNIKTVIIEETVKQVEPNVFNGMPNLETIFVMNANTALNRSLFELPNLKAIIYGANLKDDKYVMHYTATNPDLANNYETIILSKNIAVTGKFNTTFEEYNTSMRNDVNLFLTDLSNSYTQLTNNGVTVAQNVNNYGKYALESFADYEDKTSYNTLLARVRAYTKNLPQTAKNMLPAELVTGATIETSNETISSWAKSDVARAENLGIIPAQIPNDYTKNITREQFCEIITPMYEKLTGKEITETAYFQDTNSEAVEKLAGIGIVSGVGGKFFGSTRTITRAEAAAIFTRIINKLGVSVPTAATSFTDANYHWAANEIKTCASMGLITGTSSTTFTPDGNLTIEQAIVIALRAYDML